MLAGYLEWRWPSTGARGPTRGKRAALATAAAADALLFLALRQRTFRLAPYCRILLISLTPSVVNAALSCRDILLPFMQARAPSPLHTHTASSAFTWARSGLWPLLAACARRRA